MNFDNDADIVARSLRKGETLTFPGELLPRGVPISCQFDRINADAISGWCNMVRNEHERQTEQTAKEHREKAARSSADKRGDSNAGDSRADGSAAQTSGTSLEEELEARKASIREVMERNAARQEELQVEQKRLYQDLRAVEAALALYVQSEDGKDGEE